jgi:hypothetical protein
MSAAERRAADEDTVAVARGPVSSIVWRASHD